MPDLRCPGTPDGAGGHLIDLHGTLDDRCACGAVAARETYSAEEIARIERRGAIVDDGGTRRRAGGGSSA